MQVSQNEVYRLTQRALEASGAGYGIDRDGARAVAWLGARGLPGLTMLADALDAMADAFAPLAPPQRDGMTGSLDLGGRPAIAWAGAAMDCFALLLGDGRQAALTLRRCRWPLFLLPAAVEQAMRSKPLKLNWRVGATEVICIAGGDGACRIVLEGGEAEPGRVFLDGAPVDAMLETPTRNARATARATPVRVIDAAALEAALRASLQDGITVEDGVWQRIAAVAARVLVPATTDSRARGAGGGDANE
jgi:hypothetical protein